MSPELLNPAQFDIKDSRPTKESDCYALGMVILEVLSGQVPFTRGCNTFMVMGKVVGGERPERPQGAEGIWFTDNLWATLQVCWSHQPNDRLTVEAVLQCLEEVSTVWQPPPCVEMNSDESSLAVSSPGTFRNYIVNPGSPWGGKFCIPGYFFLRVPAYRWTHQRPVHSPEVLKRLLREAQVPTGYIPRLS